MSVRVVRLGSPRGAGEGLRVGTVRRPPRGVRREDLSSGNWYDVWLPQLAPSAELVRLARNASDAAEWKKFERAYRKEMAEPDNLRLLLFLAALSHSADFSVGCYCEDEAHCHRSILRQLLTESGASIAS